MGGEGELGLNRVKEPCADMSIIYRDERAEIQVMVARRKWSKWGRYHDEGGAERKCGGDQKKE